MATSNKRYEHTSSSVHVKHVWKERVQGLHEARENQGSFCLCALPSSRSPQGHFLASMCICVCVCVHACTCMCVCMLSRVQLFATPWAIAHQAPLSMEFSRQEYWSERPFPSPGALLTQGLNPRLLSLLPWQVISRAALSHSA